jgi:hypothetical protein
MAVTHFRDRTATHEGAHTAAIVMLCGHLPLKARADWPDARTFGCVLPDYNRSPIMRETAPQWTIVVLVGILADDEPPPQWPLQERAEGGDVDRLAKLVKLGQLDEEDWDTLCERARTLMAHPDFRRISALVGSALEVADELDTDDLRYLLGDLATKYVTKEGVSYAA